MEKLKGFIKISKGKFNTRKDFMIRLKVVIMNRPEGLETQLPTWVC